MNQELYHWGVKGMKWGIRRYQNKDGSLTPAGKKRYADNPDLQNLDSIKADRLRAKRAYNKAANRYSNVPTNANWDKFTNARDVFNVADSKYKKAKLDYDTKKEVSRIKESNIQIKNKSKHRLKLEEQYKEMGMTSEEAEAAANKRIRTEKILAASAAMTVAACAAYVAHSKYKNSIDGLIKSGDIMQRIEMTDTGGKLHDTFYVAKGDHDTKRYRNLLGMVRKNQTGHAYVMELQAQGDVRVASKDKAVSAFAKLYETDSSFRDSVKPYVESHFNGSNKIRNIDKLSSRNVKKMYDNFNSNLPFIREAGLDSDKKFYGALKAAGYGAIQDINDMKFSGYSAKNPLIIFDNSKNNIMVKSVKELTENVDRSGMVEYTKALGESACKDILEKAGPLSAVALTAATVKTYRSNPNDEFAKT